MSNSNPADGTPSPDMDPKKMKICTTCGKPIARSAKSCPYCGAKQKKSLLKRPWFWILVILLILMIAAHGSSSDSEEDTSVTVAPPAPETTSAQAASGSETSAGSTAAAEGTAANASDADSTKAASTEAAAGTTAATSGSDTTITIGTPVDIEDGLQMTVLSAGKYESDNEFDQPEDGKIYYRVELELANTGSTEQAISSIVSFDAYVDDYSIDQTYVNDDTLDGTLAPGKKLKGSLVYEVPKDFKTLQIDYSSSFWTNKKFTMTFTNDSQKG